MGETLRRLTAKNLAGHRVTVGFGTANGCEAFCPRHQTMGSMPWQRRRTMPSDHGFGERVQPDRKVLLPA